MLEDIFAEAFEGVVVVAVAVWLPVVRQNASSLCRVDVILSFFSVSSFILFESFLIIVMRRTPLKNY